MDRHRVRSAAAIPGPLLVVGAGSAGCTLANRLTENGDATVLVVEAGGWDHAYPVDTQKLQAIRNNAGRPKLACQMCKLFLNEP